jgi:uncharacterized cupin superfamily protein
VPNIYQPDFDEIRDHDGYRARRARVGYALRSERLGFSLWEVPPGEAAYPYHLHLAEEEALIVLSGRPRLRTPAGWRQLEEGEVVSFPAGPDGAHQVLNDTDEVVRFLALSTNGEPDVVLYPDSGKICAAERRPDGSGIKLFFRQGDAVDYWDGEIPPDGVSDP